MESFPPESMFKVSALKSMDLPVDESGPGLKGPASEAWTSWSPALARGLHQLTHNKLSSLEGRTK